MGRTRRVVATTPTTVRIVTWTTIAIVNNNVGGGVGAIKLWIVAKKHG
jgi:hypothetical protein